MFRQLKLCLCFLLLFIFSNEVVHTQQRTEINIPDIPGYITLKCDFHMHTVFSDGSVWPPVRVEEAWREGLDAIAITDHIEYQPHVPDVRKNLTRSYELALPAARKYHLIFPRAAEITKSMPPGHFNVFFLKAVQPLDIKDGVEAVKRAAHQGAFVVWNHPGDTWYEEHTKMLENGWLHGIEVVNGNRYYPEAHQWALDNNLTIMCNSDVHGLVDFSYDSRAGQHRPLTLVFVTDYSEQALKEALFDRRTVAYYRDILIGNKEFLRPILENSIQIMNPFISLHNQTASVQIQNRSDLDFQFELNDNQKQYSMNKKTVLPANKTILLNIKKLSEVRSGETEFDVPFEITNLLTAPNKGLVFNLKFSAFTNEGIRIVAEGKKFKLFVENDKNLEIFYTTDESEPTIRSHPIKKPFAGEGSILLKYCVFKNGKRFSNTFSKRILFHEALGKEVILAQKFSPKYSAGGNYALVDGSLGSLNYSDGNWQGFEQNDLDAVIDLGSEKSVTGIQVNFLRDIPAWIFLPTEVEFLVSNDGVNFRSVFNEKLDMPSQDSEKTIQSVRANLSGTKTRYIRVKAENFGICPQWHPGAGGKAWLFVDEIVVN